MRLQFSDLIEHEEIKNLYLQPLFVSKVFLSLKRSTDQKDKSLKNTVEMCLNALATPFPEYLNFN